MDALNSEIATQGLKPWLRWAGGKRQLAIQLVSEIMATKPRFYVEPFLGGGAVSLALPSELPKFLTDSNQHLIDCWLCIQKMPGSFFSYLKRVEDQYGNDLAGYQAARIEFNRMISNQRPMWAHRSALFLYLNARCFNGLWRVSSNGFNVPFGKRCSPTSIAADDLFNYSLVLKNCVIDCTDYLTILGRLFTTESRKTQGTHEEMSRILRGYAIFSDPPYAGTFDGYTRSGFDENNQRLLASMLASWAAAGAAVWATNADTPLIREAYSWAQIEETSEQHSLGSKATRRGKRPCLIIRGGAACQSR